MSQNPSRFLDRHSPPTLLTLTVMAGFAAMAQNIFLPSLPSIAAHYGTSYGTVQLSVSLFLLLSGVMQLFIGPMADHFGRRPVVLWSFVLFCLATVGLLLAPTIEIFLLFRMLQAVIAAALVLSRAIVRDIVPPSEAAATIGWVTMGMSLVPMFAPGIGGVLDQWIGWKANFVLLLGLGAVVGVLIWADQGETKKSLGGTFRGQLASYPRLLRSRRFWGYALSAAASTGAFFSYLGGAPSVGSAVFKLSPAELGLYLAAPGVGYLLGNFLSAKFSTRLGLVRMVMMGSIVLSVAMLALLCMALMGGLTHPILFFGMVSFVGLGNGLALPSANAGMMSVVPELTGSASGLGGALTICGGAGLSALAAVVMGAGDSAIPLILLMNASGIVALAAIFWVRARERALTGC